MQFPVPQFLDVEDKIIGPFGLKQFGFIFGGGLLILALFRILGTGIFFFILALPLAMLTLFISFANFNGKKAYEVIPVFVKFFGAPKKMVFQKERNVDDLNIKPITIEQIQAIQKSKEVVKTEEEPVQSRLKSLSRLLDQKREEEYEILKDRKK